LDGLTDSRRIPQRPTATATERHRMTATGYVPLPAHGVQPTCTCSWCRRGIPKHLAAPLELTDADYDSAEERAAVTWLVWPESLYSWRRWCGGPRDSRSDPVVGA